MTGARSSRSVSSLANMQKGAFDDVERTESCALPHVAVVREGALHVVMDDGS